MTELTRKEAQKLIEQQGVNIIIPDTYTSIGSVAFYNSNIKSVFIPESILYIGKSAFSYNSLTEIIIPKNVISIGWGAFMDNQLDSVSISKTVQSIEDNAFNSNNITSVVIPDKVSNIGNFAFQNNPLKFVNISQNSTFTDSSFPEKASIVLRDINQAPTNIIISTSEFNENILSGTVISELSTIDSDDNDKHTYSLVRGTGDTHNELFKIEGNQLKVRFSPDFESRSLYSIRVRTTDSVGNNYGKAFKLTVNDIDEIDFNIINSVTGKGKLRGKQGADQFTFGEFDSFERTNVDKIIGFNKSQGDCIAVNTAAFPYLEDLIEPTFTIARTKKELKLSKKQHYDFVYFEKKGQLFYNGNGTDNGWGSPDVGGLFAILKGKPELSVEDIIVTSATIDFN